MKQMISFLKEDKGQGMVEYGLIIALIAIAVIAAITLLGENLTQIFNDISTQLEGAEPVERTP
jgi:pilus assembly protein Flp/PilA